MMRGTSFLRVIGRLKPNITLKQVKAALPSLDQSYRTLYPNKIDSGFTTTVKTQPEDVTENFRPGFITLFAAVTFVLLIACTNVANLLLVRFSGRRREIALRMAIGASRAGIIRLFVFESLLVSVIAGAALLITSFLRLSQQNLGFRSQHLWTGNVTLPTAQYPDAPSRQRFVEQFLNALRDVPGVQSATASGDIPLNGGNRTLYARGDRDVPPVEQRTAAPSHDVAPDFLKTWGIPLLAGRDFNDHDTIGSPNVVLISQTGGKKASPGDDPIGNTL